MLWLVLSRSGFCSTDRFHGNGPIRVFLFWSKAGKFNICNQDSKKKVCHSSHWNYQQKLKRLEFFRNFKDGWRRRSFFKCKPPEVHFTIRNRVPYNKLLTNRACSGRTREYWPLLVFVWTSLRSVRTVATSGQYSPVWPSRSVSKRLELKATKQYERITITIKLIKTCLQCLEHQHQNHTKLQMFAWFLDPEGDCKKKKVKICQTKLIEQFSNDC